MSLQVLIRELLEVVQDLFLNYGRQTLHLLHQDALVHLNLTEVTVYALPTNWLDFCNRSLIHILFRLAFTVGTGVTITAILALLNLQFLFLQFKQIWLFGHVVLQDRFAQWEERCWIVRRLTILRSEVRVELESKHGRKWPIFLGDKATEELQSCHLVNSLQLDTVAQVWSNLVGEFVGVLQGFHHALAILNRELIIGRVKGVL